jgi:WD40 repeat protein
MEQRITGRRTFRVFPSSPTDVWPEREAVERVVRRLSGIYAEHVELKLERWEAKFYEATKSFQEQIESTANFDLVIAIFFWRIGTELRPDVYPRPDGTAFESGTVLEVEAALKANERYGRPAVFVFRKTAKLEVIRENLEEIKRQSDLLDAWWARTFRDEEGHFLRAWEDFATTHDFEDRLEKLLTEQLQKSGQIPRGPVWDIAIRRSPYPGLRPYDSDRRAVFFGRALAIRDALDELLPAVERKDGLPALFIIGPSGCGKSSLARAGIGPALTDPGTVRGVDLWRSATVEVDGGVLTRLAAQLYEYLPELTAAPQQASAEWARLASGSPEDAAQTVSWALNRAAAAEQQRAGADRSIRAGLLLLVDQLERLFGSTDEEVRQLPAALLALANTRQVWLLLTLRSDRYAELQNNPPLLELKRRGVVYDLPAPGEAEITDAVKGPALAAGLTFEADERRARTLPRALVDDTPGADALPLLQMTLSRLFEERAGMVLTWHAYEAMGGVSGAIASHADTEVAGLSGVARRELRRLVEALVRDVVRSAQGQIRFTMVQANSAWESTPARQELVERLVKARLLVRDEPEHGRNVFRAAHEAVLRQWEPARDALEGIVDAALRRARLIQFGYGLAALVFLGLSIFAGWQWGEAKNQTQVARNQTQVADAATEQAEVERDKARTELLAIQARRSAEVYTPDDIAVAGALALESIWITRKRGWPAEAVAIEVVRSALIGLPLMVLPHGAQVKSLAALTDGRLASGGNDGSIKLWPKEREEGTGEPVVRLRDGPDVLSLVGLADGRLASLDKDGRIKIWPEEDTGAPEVRSHGRGVTSLAALTDGRLASADDDGTIKIWPKDGTGEPMVLRHGSQVLSLAVLKDGRLASGGNDGNIKFWNVNLRPNGNMDKPEVHSQGKGVTSLAVLKNGRLASGDVDGNIRLWPHQGADLVVLSHGDSRVSSLAALADGQLASGDDKGNITILSKDGRGEPVVLPHGRQVLSLAVLKDGRLASGGVDGDIKLWLKDGAGEPAVRSHDSPVFSLAALAEGWLASGGGDGSIKVWPPEVTGEPDVRSHGGQVSVSSLAVLADGRLASADAGRPAIGETERQARRDTDYKINLWPKDSKSKPTVLSVGSPINSLAVLADGRLASGDEEGNIKLWHGDSAGEPEVLSRGRTVLSLAVLADGQLAAGDLDGNIKLWPKDGTGEPMVLLHDGTGVLSLVALADGQWASGGYDRTIKLWPKERTGEPVILPNGSSVWSLAALKDGRLASGSEDGSIKLWPKGGEGGTGEPVVLSRHGPGVQSLAVLADGRLASGDDDGRIKLWLVNEQELIAALCRRAGRNLTKDKWVHYIGTDISRQPSCRGLPSNWRTLDP